MRLAAILFAAFLCGHAQAQDAVTPRVRAEIQHVITAQIEAFRHDDGTAALAFASPGIAAKFSDGATFLAMVRAAYPVVFRPRSFAFGELADDDGAVQQKVELVGIDGQTALALYDMERETDGSWRISGCELEKSERIDL